LDRDPGTAWCRRLFFDQRVFEWCLSRTDLKNGSLVDPASFHYCGRPCFHLMRFAGRRRIGGMWRLSLPGQLPRSTIGRKSTIKTETVVLHQKSLHMHVTHGQSINSRNMIKMMRPQWEERAAKQRGSFPQRIELCYEQTESFRAWIELNEIVPWLTWFGSRLTSMKE
jgi:hypothetical protein